MAGSTPNGALPYAQSSDPLANWPGVSQDLATKLDPFNWDSGWIALTPAIGSGTFGYRVIGKTCWLRADLTGVSVAAGASGVVILQGAFPAAYRPSITAYAMGNGAGSVPLQWTSSSGGQISFWNIHTSTVTTARCMFSWAY